MHNYQINTAAHGISCHKASKFSESHNFNQCITLFSTFASMEVVILLKAS